MQMDAHTASKLTYGLRHVLKGYDTWLKVRNKENMVCISPKIDKEHKFSTELLQAISEKVTELNLSVFIENTPNDKRQIRINIL